MKKVIIALITMTTVVVMIGVGLVVLIADMEMHNDIPDIPTTFYETINVTEAKELMSTTELYVIDCRAREGCGDCQFSKGHLPDAGLYSSPVSFFNTTTDILVYSVDGTVGEQFCRELVGYVYGNIYNLEGGWEAWKQ